LLRWGTHWLLLLLGLTLRLLLTLGLLGLLLSGAGLLSHGGGALWRCLQGGGEGGGSGLLAGGLRGANSLNGLQRLGGSHWR